MKTLTTAMAMLTGVALRNARLSLLFIILGEPNGFAAELRTAARLTQRRVRPPQALQPSVRSREPHSPYRLRSAEHC